MTTTGTETPQLYAKCQDCGADLADRETVTAHGRDTLAPTGEPGLVARGHRVSIVNPTEAEVRVRRLRLRISDALDSAYEDLYDCVERGEFTAAEVRQSLWMFDLADGWDEYAAGDDDESDHASRTGADSS